MVRIPIVRIEYFLYREYNIAFGMVKLQNIAAICWFVATLIGASFIEVFSYSWFFVSDNIGELLDLKSKSSKLRC